MVTFNIPIIVSAASEIIRVAVQRAGLACVGTTPCLGNQYCENNENWIVLYDKTDSCSIKQSPNIPLLATANEINLHILNTQFDGSNKFKVDITLDDPTVTVTGASAPILNAENLLQLDATVSPNPENMTNGRWRFHFETKNNQALPEFSELTFDLIIV